ncbi:MAG TPA: hypothetical protein VGR39_03640 [Candidatus Acidoferrales bacterium]|nr:hypothetical protein [Candidatus Acidoferrales bacterium]
MTDKAFSVFELKGKYLIPPESGAESPPVMVAQCTPGQHKEYGGGWGKRFYVQGKFNGGYFQTASVVDVPNGEKDEILGSYRLDDQKPHDDTWRISSDFHKLGFTDVQFNSYLYGHMLPHKSWTKNPQITRVRIEFDEYVGRSVVMEFDLGDAKDVADACGVIIYKQEKNAEADGH